MTTQADQTFVCVDCREIEPIRTKGGTGYATCHTDDTVRPSGKVCYACCGIRNREDMIRNGRITLYWDSRKVTNWPGTLVFTECEYRSSFHNMAGKDGRTDVWFAGPDGFTWHGVNIGDHQILRCKRTKQRAA